LKLGDETPYMNEANNREREKWDSLYSAIELETENAQLDQFNQEFLRRVRELLPAGGAILEAGCGAGWQSLALAGSGLYQVSLLDFSEKALSVARLNFQRSGFILEDAAQPGQPAYELVFNAGVLEHYSFSQQAEILRGMASRSRRYVMALIPNQQCYWYWLWRVQKSANHEWTFGKEVPLGDLSPVFTAAGLHYVGQAYLGASWTESFVAGMAGLDENARAQILQVHRSGLVPASQTCYLLAALGSVEAALPENLPGWEKFGMEEESVPPEIYAALADAIALSASQARQLEQHNIKANALQQQQEALIAQKEILLKENLDALAKKDAQLAGQAKDATGLRAEISQKEQALKHQTELLEEIYHSHAWKLVQFLWRAKILSRNALKNIAPAKVLKRLSVTRPPATRLQAATQSDVPPVEGDEGKVIIVSRTFFDFDGNNMYFGGAERYLVELSTLVHQIGYEAEIWQCGKSSWERYFKNLKVIGIDAGGDLNRFEDIVASKNPKARLIIYSPFAIARRHLDSPTIGISHGVFWDHEFYQTFPNSSSVTNNQIKTSLEVIDRLISVDTNTLNWVRATIYRASQKCTFIPNFVDLDVFHPLPRPPDGKIVVLYPRRLYGPRGFQLVCDILPEILQKYSQVEFRFVGKADPLEETQALELTKLYPVRVKWYFTPLESMHEVYREADITLIPTTHSEGTSLSCLEALASGNAVIATNVGGLPDLVFSNFNGLLIEPNSTALKSALEKLIEDASLRQHLGETGRKVAESFSLRRWQDEWRNVLTCFLPQRDPVPNFQVPKSIVFPYTGIGWEGVKQRPHHLANQFAAAGYELYWYDYQDRRLEPEKNIHLLRRTDDLYLERPILFIYFPWSYEDIARYSNPIIIYDVLDDVSIYDRADDEKVGKQAREYQQLLLKRADFVIASSKNLFEKIRPSRPDALYVPNGFDPSHFNPDRIIPTPKLAHLRRPIIGYHGALASWFDGWLLAETARLRPLYNFVVIGPVSDAGVNSALKAQPNIHTLGLIPYDELPPYVARFDVGILPFLVNQLTNGVRPLKVLEYQSMRKPVVATPLDDLKDWPGVALASTPAEFATAIDQALDAGPIGKNPPEVEAFLRESTWAEATRILLERLNQSSP
jgi:glycosyltransferase involved in cell wall biosynthesis